MRAISKAAVIISIGVVIAFLLLAPSVNAQSVTNAPVTVPIEFVDVPLDVTIQALARELDINYLIDPRVTKWWETPVPDSGMTHMPIVNFRTNNITPKQALDQILHEYHLVLLDDPQTGVARITYPKQKINTLNYIENDTNRETLPIQFTDVPLDVCIEALAREAGINYLLDPMTGYGKPDKDGRIQQPPALSLRWDHVTAAQAFYALCKNYSFTVERDPNSHIVFLRTPDHPVSLFTDTNFFVGDTNSIAPNTNTVQPISGNDVPLDIMIKALAETAKVTCVLDPSAGDLSNATLTFKFTDVTPRQALVALCENFNLTVTCDQGSNTIHIGAKE